MNNKELYVEHEKYIQNKTGFGEVKIINNRKDTDHRKMLCFVEKIDDDKDKMPTIDVISEDNVEDYLDSINVYAVLIGSSNFSFSTYFEPKAKKGEADVFMFYGYKDSSKDGTVRIVNNNQTALVSMAGLDNVVISESFFDAGNDNPAMFLKSIFSEMIKTYLGVL